MRLSRFVAVPFLIAVMSLTACANTVRGVGRDVNQTVDAVEDTINE